MRKSIISAVVAAAAAMLITGCERIETGNTGIDVGMGGQVSKDTLGQGIYMTLFRTIYEVSGKEDTVQMNDLHPKSKDNLTMADLDVDITVQIDPTKAAAIYTRFSNDLHWHKEIGAYVVGTSYITRQARAVIYRVVADHEAVTMHQIRVKLEDEISSALQKELDHDMGPNWVMVRNVNIRNLVTDPKVEENIRAIAATQFATMQAVEGQKQAEAEAKRKLIEFEGQARAAAAQKIIEAQAIADANKIIGQSITPEILSLRQIEAMQSVAKDNTTILFPYGQPVSPMVGRASK